MVSSSLHEGIVCSKFRLTYDDVASICVEKNPMCREEIGPVGESLDLAMEMAEERFRRGELTMDQLGSYIELQAKYKTAYETMRTAFNNTYYKLERIVGIPLSAFEN